MRYRDEERSQNGYPSWPQLLDIVTGSEERITREIRTAVGYLRNQQQTDIIRVHERVDDTHETIGELRDRVTTIETLMESSSSEAPSGHLARLKAWAELIAPMREILMMLAVLGAGLAGLMQASPSARAVLGDLAARLERQAAE